MASHVDSNFKTFSFATAISAFRLVKISGAQAAEAATNQAAIGIVQEDVSANGVGTVKMWHPTYFATVSGAGIAAGAAVKATAAGTVGPISATGITMGYAVEAGTNNDIIEIAIPLTQAHLVPA